MKKSISPVTTGIVILIVIVIVVAVIWKFSGAKKAPATEEPQPDASMIPEPPNMGTGAMPGEGTTTTEVPPKQAPPR